LPAPGAKIAAANFGRRVFHSDRRAYPRGSPLPLTVKVAPGARHLRAVLDALEDVGDIQ
jgi:hypothetical protein